MSPKFFRLLPLIVLVPSLLGETAIVEGSAGGDSASASITVVVDSDGDGLTDAEELAPSLGTNPDNPDTDGDGLTDKAEVDAGKNPLVDNFNGVRADPDWLRVPASIKSMGAFRSYFDFETHSAAKKFESRKGNYNLRPFSGGVQTEVGIWNQTAGNLGKSADLGPGKYLDLGLHTGMKANNIPFSVIQFSFGCSIRIPGAMSTVDKIVLFSAYADSTTSDVDDIRIEIIQNGNGAKVVRLTRINSIGVVGIAGEWIIDDVDFSKWTEITVAAPNEPYEANNRYCIVNGKRLTLSAGGRWRVLIISPIGGRVWEHRSQRPG